MGFIGKDNFIILFFPLNRENGENPLQPRYCNWLRKLRLILIIQKATIPTF